MGCPGRPTIIVSTKTGRTANIENFPNWHEWLQEVKDSGGINFDWLEKYFPLEKMEDSQEIEALRYSLQSCQSPLVCLEDETRQFFALNPRDSWEVFEFTGSGEEREIARFLRYLINTEKIVSAAIESRGRGNYYSVDPLIYSAEYWLNRVCPEEFSVHDSDKFKLALLLFMRPRREQIFELIGRLDNSSRPGFVGGNIAVITPFNDRSELRKIARKIGRDLEIKGTRNWVLGEEIQNTHELKSRVKKYND